MIQSAPDLAELERVAGDAARTGGGIVARARHAELTVTRKGRANYVTDIDVESQRAILAVIRAAYPDHHVLAEESPTATDWAGYTWIVDPLDGTTNFTAGIPLCGVSVAVAVGREVVAGAVFDPARGELYTARRGAGTRLNGEAIGARAACSLSESLVGFDLGYDPVASAVLLECIVRLKSPVGTLRLLGSAVLGLCYVAAGRLDAYIHNDLCPWDIAAGALIVAEAGAVAVNHRGQRVSPTDSSVVATSPTLVADLLPYLR